MTLPSETDRAAGAAPLPFLIFLALMSSIVAMTIDAVLPALDAISDELAFETANDRQLVVLTVLLGLGLSQLVFGPLSDSLGRKPAALAGWTIYLAGTLLCLLATSPAMLLAGRFLQGVGAGGPRIVANAIARDLYEGRAMARILSLVLTVFMLVPMLAPLLGQALEALAGWRAIFALYLGLALATAGWHLLGIGETLAPERRRPLSVAPMLEALGEVLRTRASMAYAAAAVCVFGPFIVYLATAQQVLEELYGLGALFPWAFGAMAASFAVASLANGWLVMRLGMRRLGIVGIVLMVGASAVALGLSQGERVDGPMPLAAFMAAMSVIFAAVALLFANLTALALQPLGHVAGTASAVVMSITTLGAALLGYLIASGFDGALAPMFAGFVVLGLGAGGFMGLAERVRA